MVVVEDVGAGDDAGESGPGVLLETRWMVKSAASSFGQVRSTVMGMEGLWYFRRTSSCCQNLRGPMWPFFRSFAKRRWIREMSFGRIAAPEPTLIARSWRGRGKVSVVV